MPWVQPWSTGSVTAAVAMPHNAAAARVYLGINVMLLWGAGIEAGYVRPAARVAVVNGPIGLMRQNLRRWLCEEDTPARFLHQDFGLRTTAMRTSSQVTPTALEQPDTAASVEPGGGVARFRWAPAAGQR